MDTNFYDSSKWRSHDFAIRLMSERLRGPKEEISDGQGIHIGTIEPALRIVPCEIALGLDTVSAMIQLKHYVLKENPDLNEDDFNIEPGWGDHLMTSNPPVSDRNFITATGVTIGPPAATC